MRRGAAVGVLAAVLGLPLAADVRVMRAVRPLDGKWQHMRVASRRSTLLGISFRPPQVDDLGLDARAALTRLLAYPFQLIRLGAYWKRVEPSPGRFEPDELDWQIDAAERAGKQIIVCVGALKTFGYPEFFVPAHHLPRPLQEGSLVGPTSHPALLEAGCAFIERIVERYRDRAAIVAWQVEHESVDPLGLEHSWRLTTSFVQTEIATVRRVDAGRPILLNGFLPTSILGGVQQWWATRDQGDSLAAAVRFADILGLDVYPRLALLSVGPMTAYLDGSRGRWPKRVREQLVARALAAGRRVMVSEGQAEPWETVTTPPDPRDGAMASCTPERLIENYNTCLQWPGLGAAGLYAYLFWGAEYWLKRAQGGDESYLGAFARVLEHSA